MSHQRYLPLSGLVLSIVIMGCGSHWQSSSEKTAIQINQYQMTAKEFEEEFKNAANGTAQENARENFLENLVNRKLVLQEAERLGLNNDGEFLKAIERFYEQVLLKLTLEKKSGEFAAEIGVSDAEIESYYQKLSEKGEAEAALAKMRDEIKWELTRQKQKQAFDHWVESLRQQAKININRQELAIE